MAECQRHCPSNAEVPNEGNGKEGIGRDVGVSDIVVGMDEGTSSRAGYKEVSLQGLGPKNKGTQSMDIKKQSLVVIDKGKKPLDRTSRDVVEKVWIRLRASQRENKRICNVIVCPLLVRLLGKVIQEIGRVLEKFLGKDNLGIRDYPFTFNLIH